jgi:hypothetical protein
VQGCGQIVVSLNLHGNVLHEIDGGVRVGCWTGVCARVEGGWPGELQRKARGNADE